MKIAFFNLRKSFQRQIKKTKPFGSKHKIVFIKSPLDSKHLPSKTDFDVISIFVDSKIDEAVLRKFPKLKFIFTGSTGLDHIDLEACKKRGIKVANASIYGKNTIAEHAFGLLLALSKRIFDGYQQLRDGKFDSQVLEGFDLDGKILGVVGVGNIGRHAIKIGNGFGMEVIGYDKVPELKLERKLNFKYTKTLNELLKKSDMVTLHVPLLKSTRYLINNKNIMKMKKGAVLINTSRGEVVETKALLRALKNKHLIGAGLDVIEKEGLFTPVNRRLINMPNVIMTPHSAFNTKEALQRIFEATVTSIKDFIK